MIKIAAIRSGFPKTARYGAPLNPPPNSTRSPARKSPKLVASNVCGIKCAEKESASARLIVSETPETETDPLRAKSPRNSDGNEKRIRRPPAPSSSASKTSPVPSTWPETKCPPISSPAPQRPLQVDLFPQFQRRANCKRFRSQVRAKRVPLGPRRRQAGAVNRNAVPDFQSRRPPRRTRNPQSDSAAAPLRGGDGSGCGDNPAKQSQAALPISAMCFATLLLSP